MLPLVIQTPNNKVLYTLLIQITEIMSKHSYRCIENLAKNEYLEQINYISEKLNQKYCILINPDFFEFKSLELNIYNNEIQYIILTSDYLFKNLEEEDAFILEVSKT